MSAASPEMRQRKEAMGNRIMGGVVSLDGYIADTNGAGHPFFTSMGSDGVVTVVNPSRVVQGDRVTHLLYDVERTACQDEAARWSWRGLRSRKAAWSH